MNIQNTFLEDLKWSIETTNKQNSKKPSQTYKPSSMKCIRNMYYQVVGVEPDPDTSTYSAIGICNSGTDIHVRIQEAIMQMQKNGIDCEYLDVEQFVLEYNLPLKIIGKSGIETKLYSPQYNISFMCDGLVKYKNEYYIVEFKTETSSKFISRFGVAEEHKDQAISYSLLFGLPSVLFIYVCRDNLDMKTYLYTPSKEDIQSLVDKIKLCDQYVIDKQVPPKPTIQHLNCRYCKYLNTCNSEENNNGDEPNI